MADPNPNPNLELTCDMCICVQPIVFPGKDFRPELSWAGPEGGWVGQQMVGEVARGLSLFGGASSEVSETLRL